MTRLALAGVLALVLWSTPTRAAAAVPQFDSDYFGESAFLSVAPLQSYEFTVFFGNTGSAGWAKNTATQVNLAICREDKVTCNVLSPNAAWNDGWLSPIAYTTQAQDFVAPGGMATFKYRIRPPTTASGGVYHFHGDLGVAAALRPIHPQGYFQDATIASGP